MNGIVKCWPPFTKITTTVAITSFLFLTGCLQNATMTITSTEEIKKPESVIASPVQGSLVAFHYDAVAGAGVPIQSTASFNVSKVSAGQSVLRNTSTSASFIVAGGANAQP